MPTSRTDRTAATRANTVMSCVHVEVATHQAVEHDSFRDGEVFYRVPLAAVTVVLGLIESDLTRTVPSQNVIR